MNTNTLTEDQLLTQLQDAILSGNSTEVSKLMSEEHTSVKASTPEDTTPVPEVKEDEVVNTAADDGHAKEGTQPTAEEKNKGTPNGLPAWVEALPEDVRNTVLSEFQALHGQVRELDHYRRSNEGRIAALQRKSDTLQRELESRRQSPPPVKQEAAPSIKLDDDPAMVRLKEEDPALYELQKKRDEAVLKHAHELVEKAKAEFNSTLEKTLTPIQQEREEAVVAREQAYVLERVPNAPDVLASEAWAYFEQNAPSGIRRLIDSTSGEDLVIAMRFYADWLKEVQPAREEPVAKVPEVKPPVTNEAAAIAEERKRKLEAGAPRSKGSVSVNQIADPEAALEEIFQKKYKDMGYDTFNQSNRRK